MNKVLIKSKLISDEENFFNGKGILRKNELIFYDNKIKTKVKILENKIILERTLDYILTLEFIKHTNTKATYNIYGKNLNLEIYTNELKINENNIFINYDLTLNEDEKMNFTYYIEYSIDSEI